MNRFSLAAALCLCLVGFGCQKQPEVPPSQPVNLFEDVTIHFTPDDSSRFDTPFATARDNGRVMTTYRELPALRSNSRVTLQLEVRPIPKDIRNMHDRWDRAGWVRLIKPGMAPVELCRFMTAYGGAITHEVDITRVLPLLEGHCEFEVFIDTWVTPAWKVDVTLAFQTDAYGEENPPHWGAGLFFPEGGLKTQEPMTSAEVVIPQGLRRTELALISTGHCTDGRDADEFITKENVVLVDGQEVYRWRPWRDDCTEFRSVNPYCAKWSDGSWSSDYSRSGWCPGDVALPQIVDLTPWLTPGAHTISMLVEDIRPADDDGQHGYWRVSGTLAGWK